MAGFSAFDGRARFQERCVAGEIASDKDEFVSDKVSFLKGSKCMLFVLCASREMFF